MQVQIKRVGSLFWRKNASLPLGLWSKEWWRSFFFNAQKPESFLSRDWTVLEAAPLLPAMRRARSSGCWRRTQERRKTTQSRESKSASFWTHCPEQRHPWRPSCFFLLFAICPMWVLEDGSIVFSEKGNDGRRKANNGVRVSTKKTIIKPYRDVDRWTWKKQKRESYNNRTALQSADMTFQVERTEE